MGGVSSVLKTEEITSVLQMSLTNQQGSIKKIFSLKLYEGWNFNSGNYLFTTDTK